jgi:predicted helicase
MGLGSSRDSWVYGSSRKKVLDNMKITIDFYNQQSIEFTNAKKKNSKINVSDFISSDSKKISWSSSLIPKLEKGLISNYEPDKTSIASYRPFNKQLLYLGENFIHRRGQFEHIFSSINDNIIIAISSTNKGLGLLVTNCIADIHFNGDTQCFPLYFYEENNQAQKGLFDEGSESDFIRRDGVSDFILERATKQYGKNVTKEDVFYYVYGFLHSPEYRETFANDLKKMLPRLPLVDDVKDFWAFSNAGRKLAELHLNYETVAPYPGVNVSSLEGGSKEGGYFRVEKMRFPKKGQKDTIIYNSKITISNIPEEAYDYVVNGKSAIEWIMERYAITTHKDSGITNDPNDWADEVGNPRYILDLLLSIINVSVQTVEIVKGLPKVKFE